MLKLKLEEKNLQKVQGWIFQFKRRFIWQLMHIFLSFRWTACLLLHLTAYLALG